MPSNTGRPAEKTVLITTAQRKELGALQKKSKI